jgi:RNA polymerase sigma-70 factor (ECF subfamily)
VDEPRPPDAKGESDEALVAALAAGEGRALRRLMERHQAQLFGYLRRMVGDAHAAEDLFQETFLRVVRHAGRFDGARRFRPWLYTIACNLIRNHYRARGTRQGLSLDAEGETAGGSLGEALGDLARGPVEEVEARELARLVRLAVERLPLGARAAIDLFYLRGLSYEEISLALEVPLGTVKSRIHNGTKRLARLVGEVGAENQAEHPQGGETAFG